MSVIVSLDLETTGTDPEAAEIVQVSAVQIRWDLDQPGLNIRRSMNSFCSIQGTVGQSQEVHGISDEFLRSAPHPREVLPQLVQLMEGVDAVVGYNVDYDLRLVRAQCARHGVVVPQEVLELPVICAFSLWREKEKRDLETAHRRFCGTSFAGAHDAFSDACAAARVLRAQLEHWELGDKSWRELEHECFPERAAWLGPTHHLARGEGDAPVVNFGKHAGTPLRKVPTGYLRWMLDQGFPEHVRAAARAELERRRAGLCECDDSPVRRN